MSLDIKLYEPWMGKQVSSLFAAQYGVDPAEFGKQMEHFYEHPFQKKECIRIVAMSGEQVAGFQTFFYWPYQWKGRSFRSFQSGNSLVHPEHRGKGIFAALLKYLDEELVHSMGIEFLMGFPVEQSRKSFLRNQWHNILDLKWYVKPLNPFSVFRSYNPSALAGEFRAYPERFPVSPERISLLDSPAFRSWRKAYQPGSNVFYFSFEENGKEMSCALKLTRRKRIIKELIIGDVRCNSADPGFIQNGLTALEKKARASMRVGFLSMAVNPSDPADFGKILRERGFRELSNKIYFIVKNFIAAPEILRPDHWSLFRSDIDTW